MTPVVPVWNVCTSPFSFWYPQGVQQEMFSSWNCCKHTLKNCGHQRTSATCSAICMIVYVLKVTVASRALSFFRCSNQYLKERVPNVRPVVPGMFLGFFFKWSQGCHPLPPLYLWFGHDICTSLMKSKLFLHLHGFNFLCVRRKILWVTLRLFFLNLLLMPHLHSVQLFCWDQLRNMLTFIR